MATATETVHAEKPTKKERIFSFIAKGECHVRIKQEIRDMPLTINVDRRLILNRPVAVPGIISGFDINLGPTFYKIKTHEGERLYHIDDFRL